MAIEPTILAKHQGFLATLILALCLAWPQTVAAQFGGGDGTAANPWRVGTAAQLDAMRQYLGPDHADKYFVLTANIDLAGAGDQDGWLPIGSPVPEEQFRGHLDGNGRAIRNLFINRPLQGHQGLFGTLNEASIRSLRLENVQITGASYVGAVTGMQLGGLVDDVRVSGSVQGVGATRIGGLVGEFRIAGTIQRSRMVGTVTGQGDLVGGLVGYMESPGSLVSQSFSLGSVTGGGERIGGLIGGLRRGAVIDCYSQASVTGGTRVGGLIGLTELSDVFVQRSYSSGAVSGSGPDIGGFLGLMGASPVFRDNYWDTEASGQPTSAGGPGVSGKTTAEMQQRQSFFGFNFHVVWRISEGADYPSHQDLKRYAGPQAVDLGDLPGAGTPENPWIISNIDQLNAMRQNLAAHYRLGNDIDLAATAVWNGGRGWQPIGGQPADQRFTGSLDGAGNALRNLQLSQVESDWQGLFAFLQDASVRDLQLQSAWINGKNYTGGLAAGMAGGEVDGVSVSGYVSAGTRVGGVIADVVSGVLIQRSRMLGDVRGTSADVGGVVGFVNGTTASISQAYSQGSVHSLGDNVGGLVGRIRLGSVVDSYSQADVTGNSKVGGLIGTIDLSSVTVQRSYSAGPVSGSDSDIGGFLGLLSAGATLSDNYWDTEASGQAASAGGVGVMARTTAQMQTQANYVGWDFDETWTIREGWDYPRLRIRFGELIFRDRFEAGAAGPN